MKRFFVIVAIFISILLLSQVVISALPTPRIKASAFSPSSIPIWGGEFGGFFTKVSSGPVPPPDGTLIDEFDPTLGVTIDTGAVSSVANQVLAAPAATQSDPTKRPTITQFGDNAADIFLFDGVDDVLTFTIPSDVPKFLVAFFMVPDVQTIGKAVGGSVGTSNPALQWGLIAATRFSIILNNGSVAVQGGSGLNQPITSGTPAVMAMNYDGTTLRALRGNGGSVSAGTAAVAGVKIGSGNTFYIGNLPGKTGFSGMMGNIRIYYGITTNLSSTQVIDLYTVMQDRYGF